MKFFYEEDGSTMTIHDDVQGLDRERSEIVASLLNLKEVCRKYQGNHCDRCPLKVGFDCPFVLAPRFWNVNDGSTPWKAFEN